MTPIEKLSTLRTKSKKRFTEEMNLYEQEKAEDQKDSLFSTANFARSHNQEKIDQLYYWYADAMERRNREPLEMDRFMCHFFEGGSLDETFMYGNQKNGYLLGVKKFDVFIPSHFAPRTLKGGYRLIKEIGSSKNIPTIMFITKDLAKTISKMPEWKIIDAEKYPLLANDRFQKVVAYNSHPDIQEALKKLLEEYLKEYGKQNNFEIQI